MKNRLLSFVLLGAAGLTGACTKLNDPTVMNTLPVGQLDTTFNGTGFVVLTNTQGNDVGRGVTTDSNGNIVGISARNMGATGYDMAVFRLTASGAFDTSFNGTGLLTVDGSAGAANQADSPFRVHVDASDNLLITGDAYNASNNYDLIVWRVTSAGALDTSFDGDGILVQDSGAYDTGRQVMTDDQGRIIVAGVFSDNTNGDYEGAVWRLAPGNGSLDATFSGTGRYVRSTATTDWVKDMAIDGIGRYVVAGSQGADLAIWRVASNGGLDTSFGTNGVATYSAASTNFRAEGVAIDAQGRVVVAGWRLSGGNYDAMLWRFDASGNLDTSFGNNGVVVLDSGGRDIAWDMELDAVGNILVCGEWDNGTDRDMILWRFLPDGTPDTQFGGDYDANNTPDGYVLHASAAGVGNDLGYRVALDAQGRILVIGDSDAAADRDVVIWRFE